MADAPKTATDASPLLTELSEKGFVIIRSLLPPPLIASLRAACAEVTAVAREGKWPHVRTIGKQFPPWPSSSDPEAMKKSIEASGGIWGVQGLMNPEIGDRSSKVFAGLYFDDLVLAPVREILRCEDDGELVMELMNLLVRPEKGFELRWHRDDVPASVTGREEEEMLGLTADEDGGEGQSDSEEGEGGGARKRKKTTYTHTQYNIPLYPDDSLIVIPGSHLRARTPAEVAAGDYEPSLPGMLNVHLNEGDCVFYDNNILHRGVYDSGKERMTLHGSVGHVRAGRKRARNVLQHGVGEWVGGCGYFGDLGGREVATGMRDRLIRLGMEVGGEVGYSLEG